MHDNGVFETGAEQARLFEIDDFVLPVTLIWKELAVLRADCVFNKLRDTLAELDSGSLLAS